MIDIHDHGALAALTRQQKLDPHQLKCLRNNWYKNSLSPNEVVAELPHAHQTLFKEELSFHNLTLISRHDSTVDGASKLIFKTQKGFLIESVVLRVKTGRTALCVSSQVGCAAKCDFCATGKMGIAQNLSPKEILDQVSFANQLLKSENRRVRNIVFMGMGEPFHNEGTLRHVIDSLRDPRLYNTPDKYLLVSTVGIADKMLLFTQSYPHVNIALSLHSARQAQRERIIPLAKKYPLPILQETIKAIAQIQQHNFMLEYLMLDGINDQPEDIDALMAFCKDIPVHINLIPYNQIEDAPHLIGTLKEKRDTFAKALKSTGLTVTQRYSLGADIDAACGQLVKSENRKIAIASKQFQ